MLRLQTQSLQARLYIYLLLWLVKTMDANVCDPHLGSTQKQNNIDGGR